MADLTEHIYVLQHALGLDRHGQGRAYRNHFVTDRESVDFKACARLVQAKLMTVRSPTQISGGGFVFQVTELGRAFVRENSQPPPKLTRSQQRYQRFLNEDSGLRFAEWLVAHG